MSREILDEIPEELQDRVAEWTQDGFVKPMLATLTHDTFSHKDWIFERKLDGERCIVTIENGNVTLWSRSGKELNDIYPELVEALEDAAADDMVVDGEIVAFDGDLTSFSKLQQRMQVHEPGAELREEVPVYLYLFDILSLLGKDLTALPLRQRKSILRKAIDWNDKIAFTNHRNENGEELLEEACDKGWEGLIAKRADSPYLRTRSKKWLKFKCGNRQEFVIAGFTEPQGSRVGFGALLLGYYDNGDLRYAGKVGTGFDNEMLEDLHSRLEKLERKTSPYSDDIGEEAHWITPKLVGEVAFTEWTSEHKLRHPRFVGLRHDKPAEKVIREEPLG